MHNPAQAAADSELPVPGCQWPARAGVLLRLWRAPGRPRWPPAAATRHCQWQRPGARPTPAQEADGPKSRPLRAGVPDARRRGWGPGVARPTRQAQGPGVLARGCATPESTPGSTRPPGGVSGPTSAPGGAAGGPSGRGPMIRGMHLTPDSPRGWRSRYHSTHGASFLGSPFLFHRRFRRQGGRHDPGSDLRLRPPGLTEWQS